MAILTVEGVGENGQIRLRAPLTLPEHTKRNLVWVPAGMAESISAARQLVTARAQGRYEYCQSPEAYATERFSVEHIQPRRLQGLTVPANLALACQGCNGDKSGIRFKRDTTTRSGGGWGPTMA